MDTQHVTRRARLIERLGDIVLELVDDAVSGRLKITGADDLESHTDQPEGKRVAAAAARAGQVAGAVKSGKHWVAPRSAWAEWRASRAPKDTAKVDMRSLARKAAK